MVIWVSQIAPMIVEIASQVIVNKNVVVFSGELIGGNKYCSFSDLFFHFTLIMHWLWETKSFHFLCFSLEDYSAKVIRRLSLDNLPQYYSFTSVVQTPITRSMFNIFALDLFPLNWNFVFNTCDNCCFVGVGRGDEIGHLPNSLIRSHATFLLVLFYNSALVMTFGSWSIMVLEYHANIHFRVCSSKNGSVK